VRHVAPEHTASVAAGYFDPATRKLTWAQAGHLPLVLVRGGRATMLDSPEGVLLGAGTGCYSAASAQLDIGDLLLLYSDGLVERRGRSLDDGLAGLAAAAHGSGDPEQTVTAILDALRSAEPEDDTCLVALQIL
jgi:serine phosphatase RsbU (regulator of sigma subunit)